MVIKKSMSAIKINDLYDYGYSICQIDEYFKFSIDSVLLAEFVSLKKGKNKIIDLCTGSAPIPMILQKKYGDLDITAVELQEEVYELAKKSLEINHICSIKLINMNVLDIKNVFKHEKFDVVTCNPPYFKVTDTSLINTNKVKSIARHEVMIDLRGLILTVSKIIQNHGYFYMVHHVTRFVEVVDILHEYNFGIKRIVFVHDDEKRNASLFLIEAMFNGKDNINVLAPVIVKNYNSFKNIF